METSHAQCAILAAQMVVPVPAAWASPFRLRDDRNAAEKHVSVNPILSLSWQRTLNPMWAHRGAGWQCEILNPASLQLNQNLPF